MAQYLLPAPIYTLRTLWNGHGTGTVVSTQEGVYFKEPQQQMDSGCVVDATKLKRRHAL